MSIPAPAGARRIALVTGAGTGIGRAVAHALLADNWCVALAGRRLSPLEDTARSAGDHAGRTLVHAADVTDPASVDALFATVVARFGRLDLLFNNAGINVPGVPFDELTFADWSAVIGVNLSGMFLCAQAAFRQMKRQAPRGGRIINNGSLSAHAPRPDSAPYTASKHGVTGLTRSISLDGRAFDIACGQIDIGNATTELADRARHGTKQAAGHLAVEPMMDVREVGRSVQLMASLPLDSNIPFLTVMANAMPFIGRG
ncbi:MAG: SDR family oxidoreductase [Gluconacetobacter diazotrophicus]|nr:SDR family oxidoreductase [Gluconacetobacter diazotrophicus]